MVTSSRKHQSSRKKRTPTNRPKATTRVIVLLDLFHCTGMSQENAKTVALQLIKHIQSTIPRSQICFCWPQGEAHSEILEINDNTNIRNVIDTAPASGITLSLASTVNSLISVKSNIGYREVVIIPITDGYFAKNDGKQNIAAEHNASQKIGGQIVRVCCILINGNSNIGAIKTISGATFSPYITISESTEIGRLDSFVAKIYADIKNCNNRSNEAMFRLKSAEYVAAADSLRQQGELVNNITKNFNLLSTNIAEAISGLDKKIGDVSKTVDRIDSGITRISVSKLADILSEANNVRDSNGEWVKQFNMQLEPVVSG